MNENRCRGGLKQCIPNRRDSIGGYEPMSADIRHCVFPPYPHVLAHEVPYLPVVAELFHFFADEAALVAGRLLQDSLDDAKKELAHYGRIQPAEKGEWQWRENR